ncbi:MAG: hypothetical protein ACREP9_22520 [Candidatus Dormibacteraceae bacterium]
MQSRIRMAIGLGALASLSAIAHAGDIYINDTFVNGNPGGYLNVDLDGMTGSYNVVEFNTTRVSPGGSTNLLPGVGYNFDMYCVDFGNEIGQGGN